jgi:hypothetical protein
MAATGTLEELNVKLPCCLLMAFGAEAAAFVVVG